MAGGNGYPKVTHKPNDKEQCRLSGQWQLPISPFLSISPSLRGEMMLLPVVQLLLDSRSMKSTAFLNIPTCLAITGTGFVQDGHKSSLLLFL